MLGLDSWHVKDRAAQAPLHPEFHVWLAQLDALAWREGCKTTYTQQTGIECWIDPFCNGVTPEEAWAEEKAAGAHDAI